MADEEANLNDRDKLISMLEELIRILNAVILEQAAPLPGELAEPIRAAWLDFDENYRNRVFAALREVSMEELEAVGLTGVQLEVKRVGFWGASGRWWRKRILKELQNVLGWANIWLKSLKGILKVSEILVELKEVVEKALDMINEEA
jgi:hypothetical protein